MYLYSPVTVDMMRQVACHSGEAKVGLMQALPRPKAFLPRGLSGWVRR